MATINEIKNLALFTIGEPDEIDFTDTGILLVQKVNRIYETSKNFVLSNYYWRFAERRAELTSVVEKTDTFTADAGTDFITITGSIWDGLEVQVSSTTTLPSGLTADTIYYTVSHTGLTTQLSLTRGGTAIDITDAGTGVHTITFMDVYNSPYKYLYEAPADTLVLRKAYQTSDAVTPINSFEFDYIGLHTDAKNSDDSIWFWYLADVDETLFPVYFVDYFKYKLALDLCFNLTGDTDLIQLLTQKEQAMLITAKNIDAKQVKTRTVRSSPFINIRG